MRTLRLAACLLAVVALSGCHHGQNYKDARVVQSSERYIVTLSGKRVQMAHGPISAIRGKKSEAHLVLDLPRRSGVIRGDEIPTKPGFYKYLGTVEITGDRMSVNLFYDNTDDGIRDPLSWNGDYVLVE